MANTYTEMIGDPRMSVRWSLAVACTIDYKYPAPKGVKHTGP
jgi:hypothetical protein